MKFLKIKNEARKLPFPVMVIIFALILAGLIAASFAFIGKRARVNFEKSSHKELSQLCKNMKLKFELGLNEQLVLAQQMAKSPLIVKYFEDPSDSSVREDAFEEVLAYQNSFLSKLSFMINDADLKYYSDNKYLYTLDKDDPTSVWYTSLIDTDKSYVFNVDYDIGLKQTFMWVNCIVRNYNGDFLGLIGTGIPISEFVNSLYSDLPENYSMYIFNNALETTGSPELSHLENKTPITEVIPAFANREYELEAIGESFIDTDNTVFGFEPFEEIGWTLVMSKDYTVASFLAGAIGPASICLVVIVFVVLVFFSCLRIQLLHSNEKKVGISILEEIQNLAVSSKETAATAQDQSAAVKEIVATMEDNTALSEDISQKIKDVSGAATKTSGDVSDGVAYLEENVKQLQEIAATNMNTISGIRSLGDKIENIWDIVTLINSVADQAKIIAFNAELEASSAGEAGRNFHIVATEIRRLADGIIDGTKEIKERITEIQQSSDSLILASQSGTEKIQEGVDNAKNLEERFTSIKNASESTADSAGKITTIIQQQAAASEQILITLKQIASGVENFSSATEHISQSSQNLKNIAEELSDKKGEKRAAVQENA
ncbi:methyl-accepting chemotaxis protein [uncultured Treponema sp.]|uniref:methyl-accepting chemotaxis protein n=1 Tax=uncultured Treponema sp. TaxID=162155 RepID=UPI0025ECEE44|nr:methyl-accepting chemotaxis protein [uncultured Treponema sp.]